MNPMKSVPVEKWDHEKLDRYMDSCIGGFTPEQIDHMAWYLGTVSEGRMREKEIAEKVQTEVDKEKLESYGESFDDPDYGRKD